MKNVGFISTAFLLAASLANAAVILGPGAGGIIPDATDDVTPGILTLDILVNLPGVIALGNAVTVDLVGLIHPFAGDLIVTLTHLDDTGLVTLGSGTVFARIGKTTASVFDLGYSPDFFDTYHFNSGFTGDIWTSASMLGTADTIPGDQAAIFDPSVTGNYFTTDPFSNSPNSFSTLFAGQPLAGIWRLTITDNSAGDTGSLDSWTLTVDNASASVPEPGYGTISGLAILVLLSVRWRLIATRRRDFSTCSTTVSGGPASES